MTLCRSLLTCTALLIVLAVALRSPVDAQPSTGMGLVVAVDLERKTLELETARGPGVVLPLAAATILDDRGRALPLAEIKPGDAVSFEATAGSATIVRVTRQFWAVPMER